MYPETIFSSKTSFCEDVMGRVIVSKVNSPPAFGKPTIKTVARTVSNPSLLTLNLIMK